MLRGVHVLSVAHIPPGAEIEVSSTWAASLAFVGGRGRLRIPLTVGDIYGRSCLADADELIHGGPTGGADLVVRCRDAEARLAAGRLEDGRARVPLDAPIDLVVDAAAHRPLRGRAADGRDVVLSIRPLERADGALDLAVLIDHSASMAEACSAPAALPTKHQALVQGLRALAGHLGGKDMIDLWEFDSGLAHLGSTATDLQSSLRSACAASTTGERLHRLVNALSGPRGGTEIGAALAGTMASSLARDILLVTDGKSHGLDVQSLARMGRRIGVVLVGEDSLEANVGHLAALTGGDILVAAGADLAEVLAAAVEAMRTPFETTPSIDGPLRHVRALRGNAVVEAEWRAETGADEDRENSRAIAALAASLALPALDEDAAIRLAEAEGLVTHLTSLVLVDEASDVQEGLPAARKIALPTPRTADFTGSAAGGDFADRHPRGLFGGDFFGEGHQLFGNHADPALFSAGHWVSIGHAGRGPATTPIDLSQVADRIDWDAAPAGLQRGDVSGLDPAAAALIERAAALSEVVDTAKQLDVSPIVLILALLAQACAFSNRSAARLARAVLGSRMSTEIAALSGRLGLRRLHRT